MKKLFTLTILIALIIIFSPPGYAQVTIGGTSVSIGATSVGTVTHTGTLTSAHVIVGNGTADIKPDTGCTTAVVGNKVCLLGRDSTHYLTVSYTGSWTAN